MFLFCSIESEIIVVSVIINSFNQSVHCWIDRRDLTDNLHSSRKVEIMKYSGCGKKIYYLPPGDSDDINCTAA